LGRGQKMKILPLIMIAASLAMAVSVIAKQEVTTGGLETIRGISTVYSTKSAEALKRVIKDKNPIKRNYVHQPPVIPHQIRGYRVNTNSNKCLTCHGWKYARETGATKISLTHFETRDGKTLSEVSPRRYFCSQCHVTQADAPDLGDNTFKPVESLGSN
jgi:cytochrome c-type protein NapB